MVAAAPKKAPNGRSEEHTSELQSQFQLVCRLLLEKKKTAGEYFLNIVMRFRAGLDHGVPLSTRLSMMAVIVIVLTSISGLGSLIIDFFFFNDTATTEIYTLSLHDALPILCSRQYSVDYRRAAYCQLFPAHRH